MAGTEQRVSDLEKWASVTMDRLETIEARLDYAGKLIHVLADFAKEAGVRIAAVEERATVLEHSHDLLEDRVKELEQVLEDA